MLFVNAVMQHEEQILNCNMPDTEDGITYENQDEDAMAVVDESPAVGSLNLNIPGIYFHVPISFFYTFDLEILFHLIILPVKSILGIR